MSLLLNTLVVSGAFVAGCLAGHRVVAAVQTELSKLHTKLDKLVQKTENTVHALRK